MINGNNAFSQFLWKSDCSSNPCSPQAGTWQFARAGWCPGQQVTPDDYDLTAMVTPGSQATFDYVLEPYFNECSPWNPPCQNNVTCTECNYNGGSHTQPNYKISAQLIVSSSTPVTITGVEEVELNNAIKLYPSPSNGQMEMRLDLAEPARLDINVVDMSGRSLYRTETGMVQRGIFPLDLAHLPEGLYMVHMQTENEQIVQKIIIAH